MRCTNCESELEAGASFCGACGSAARPPDAAPCPTCGHHNRVDVRFCTRCGRPLEPAASAPEGSPGPARTEQIERVPRGHAQTTTPRGSAQTTSALGTRVGLASAAGFAVAMFGTALPWVSIFDVSATGWDLSLFGLLFGTSLGGGFRASWILVPMGLGLIPLATKRPLQAHLTFVLGAVAVIVAGAAAIRGATSDPPLRLGAGLLFVAAGGILLIIEDLLSSPRERPVRSVFPAPAASTGPFGGEPQVRPGAAHEEVGATWVVPPPPGTPAAPTEAFTPAPDEPPPVPPPTPSYAAPAEEPAGATEVPPAGTEESAADTGAVRLKNCPACGRETWGARCGYCGHALE